MDRLIDWLIFLGLGLSLVYLISQSLILSFLRRAIANIHPFFESLLYCPSCTGFWVGILLGFFDLMPQEPGSFDLIYAWPISMFVSGLLTMIAAHGWWGWLYQGINPAYTAERATQGTSRNNAAKEETQSDR